MAIICLLAGGSPSAFLICLDDQFNATWAKVISSSEASNIHALESDYWGDLLSEFLSPEVLRRE